MTKKIPTAPKPNKGIEICPACYYQLVKFVNSSPLSGHNEGMLLGDNYYVYGCVNCFMSYGIPKNVITANPTFDLNYLNDSFPGSKQESKISILDA